MKKGTTTIIIIVIIAVIAIWAVSSYNSLVKEEENVRTQWSNVEAEYQRRMDLIPNLVNTVKGYATHEQETFVQTTMARAQATKPSEAADGLTAENLQAYDQAQGQVYNAMRQLLLVREAYPELQANENFLQLQNQLEGTENRIKVARRDYNTAAQVYNTMRRRAPRNIIAGIFGFSEKPLFQASEGADVAPRVEFAK